MIDWLISLLCKGLSRVFSNTTVQKHQFFGTQPSLWSSSHIRTRLLEKPYLWLYGPLLAKWCLCFLIPCLGLSCMDARVGLWRKLSAEELMLLNCGVGEDSESPLDCKEIQPVHSEWDQPWDFFGRNDAKAETPVLWPPHAKSWLIRKDSDAGRDWGQEEKGMTEDEMAGWHNWLDGCEFEWTPGDGDGQGGLASYDSWGRKESDMTEQLNWTELMVMFNCVLSVSRER